MSLFTRQRRRDLIAAGTAGVLALAGIAVATSGPARAATGCAVTYSANSWSGGFTASISIKNLGSAINGWTLGFAFPTTGQKAGQGWSATISQSGTAVTARSLDYNGALATGASTGIGFNGTFTGTSNPSPTAFTLNGVRCTGSTAPTPAPTTTTPRPPTTTTRPPTPPSTTRPPTAPASATPVGINGQLRVCGRNLCNQYGKAIQLRGVSTHGLQWFARCYNTASLDVLAKDWKADLLRIAMYVQEGGYETNPTGFTNQVNGLVDQAEARGLYALIDFHTLSPGDPNYNLDRAKTFFGAVSKRNAAKKNVIYEITNEPNGVSWAQIKTYANAVIPIIRANDPDAVIIVGTPGWSSLGKSSQSSKNEVINSPLSFSNVMYTFHFYAASHFDDYRAVLERGAAKLPMFVTEFGTVTYTGNGYVDQASSNAWFALMDRLKISYANWTYSEANESSAAFKPGTCSGTTYAQYAGTGPLNPSGVLVRSHIVTPDTFPTR